MPTMAAAAREVSDMALNGLLDIQIAVPNPQELFDFWLQHGMGATADGVLGTHDRPV